VAIDGFKVHGALALAVLASGVGAAIAGGGSSGVVLAGPQVLRLIQQAPAALDSYPALSVSMTVRVSGRGQSDATITGTTTPDGRTEVLSMEVPSAGTYLDIETLDGRVYARRAGDKHWLACTPNSAQGVAPTPSGTDGLSYLRLMPGATGPVRFEGHSTIDGVKTTRYRVNIDMTQALQAAAAREGTSVDQAKVQALQQLGIRTLPIDAWLDEQHAMRQFAFSMHVQGISLSFKMRIRGSNKVPTVSAPAPADVTVVVPCQLMFQQLAR
jgi:hypothetical protein